MKTGKRSLVSTFVALMMGLAGLGFFATEVHARPHHGYHHARSHVSGHVAQAAEPTWDPWNGYTQTDPRTGRVHASFAPGDRSAWHSGYAQQASWGGSSGGILGQARSMLGLSERGNRGTLARTLGVDPARTPWCAAWANAILRRSGYHGTGSNMARSFYGYGHRSNGQVGDIAVLRGGHHVGFVAGYSYRNGRRYVQVLGGNQHNRVQVSSFPASGAVFRDPS